MGKVIDLMLFVTVPFVCEILVRCEKQPRFSLFGNGSVFSWRDIIRKSQRAES